MTLKGGTLFSGGGGFCLGMVAAGVDHAWGVEYDDKIAQVARDNGLATITADILECNPADFEPVDFLHASTPCKSGSAVNAHSAGETENDRRLALKVAEFIDYHKPKIFTLENVWIYRTFESFNIILGALHRGGYFYHFEHVDAADFGVPQSRMRLILRAAKGRLLPPLVPTTPKHIGWASVIPTPTKDATLTNDQQEWTKDIPHPFIIDTQNRRYFRENSRYTVRLPHEPAMTITASGFARIKMVNGTVKSWGIEQVKAIQTFPDWYRLPNDNRPAQTIIGNAVPPLFAQRLVEWLK